MKKVAIKGGGGGGMGTSAPRAGINNYLFWGNLCVDREISKMERGRALEGLGNVTVLTDKWIATSKPLL